MEGIKDENFSDHMSKPYFMAHFWYASWHVWFKQGIHLAARDRGNLKGINFLPIWKAILCEPDALLWPWAGDW